MSAMISESRDAESPSSLAILLLPTKSASNGATIVRDPKGYEPEPLRIARQFVEALNERNWAHSCNAYFAPTFRARHDNWKAELSWEEQHKLYIATIARFPNFHMEILGESIDLEELSGKATVYHFIRVTGAPDGVRRDGLGLMKWRKEHGAWLCYHHSGFRSGNGVW